jgi:hypothetical protein
MKIPTIFLKVSAVGCSVLLVSGLISYQAGAFKNLLNHDAPAVGTEKTDNTTDNPSDATPPMDPDAMAEAAFHQADTDADGLLNYDEMDVRLKEERDKWDENEDGFIDLIEFKAYFLACLKRKFPELEGKLEMRPVSLPRRPASAGSPGESKNDTSDTAQSQKTFMGGSKYAPVFVPKNIQWVIPAKSPEQSK